MKTGFPPIGNYKVMVQCITYNQSKYIEDTLKGFAMQQTNFPFVCCIYDDASTDGEQEVLKRWIENHCNSESVESYDHPLTIILMASDKDNPNCIYAIHLQKVNTWGKPEKQEMMSHWEKRCEYIALCEGDDYWIDPLKLQKQVDFLDENPGYVMVYTNAKKYYQREDRLVEWNYGQQDNSYESLLLHNPVPTLTALYKQVAVADYHNIIRPQERSWLLGDYPIWLWLSLQGKIKFLPENSGIYRVLNESASHFKDYEPAKRFMLSSISVKVLYTSLFKANNMEFIEDANNKNLLSLAFKYKEIKDLKLYFSKIKHKSIKDRLKLLIGCITFPRKCS